LTPLDFKATKRKQTLERKQQKELTWLILQKDEVGSSWILRLIFIWNCLNWILMQVPCLLLWKLCGWLVVQ